MLAGPAEWPAPESHRGALVAEVGTSEGELLRNGVGAKSPYCFVTYFQHNFNIFYDTKYPSVTL